MAAIRRAISVFRPAPYVVAVAIACLIVLAGWALISIFMTPGDTLVIEVVPLTDPDQIRVQVEGEVGQPGVYLLPSGSTYEDAIEAAGGYREANVDVPDETSRRLEDGEVLRVVPIAEQAADEPEILNVNTASAAELERLPGIGPVLAGRIVAYREEHGPFGAVDELVSVSGISERMVTELRPHVVLDTP